MSKTKLWKRGFFAQPLTNWSWNTSVNDNLLISEYSSQKTEIVRHSIMGMYQEELKELSELFSLLVAPDLGLAWASKVIYLQEKKQWAKTTISLLQGDSWKLISLNISFLGIKTYLRAPMVWKIFLTDIHFDDSDENVSNVLY